MTQNKGAKEVKEKEKRRTIKKKKGFQHLTITFFIYKKTNNFAYIIKV